MDTAAIEVSVILLDDVTSELDENRASFLFELLGKIPVQTFLTATSVDNLPAGLSDYNLFVVESGCVRNAKH